MCKISGFIILRKPDRNFDKKGRGGFLSHAPKIHKVYYGGVDRMPWFELDEGFFFKKLPDQLTQLRREIRTSNPDNSDFKLLFDLSKVVSVLNYSNQHDDINEIIVLQSDVLRKTKGSFYCDAEIKWLGTDIYCHGYGSLLREGIFTKPNAFIDFSNMINKFGLLNMDNENIDSYIQHYLKCSTKHNLEEIPSSGDIDIIKLGRIL